MVHVGGRRNSVVGLGAIAMGWAVLLAGIPAVAAQEDVNADIAARSVTVGNQDWDAYRFVLPGGKQARVSVSAGESVDFYVFTQSQYNDYSNPSVPSFGFESRQERATSFSYVVSTTGWIIVVDNADVSTTGASPSGPADYTLTVTFENAPPYWLYGLIVLVLLIVVIAAVVMVRRKRQKAMPPPMMPPGMQPPTPPQ